MEKKSAAERHFQAAILSGILLGGAVVAAAGALLFNGVAAVLITLAVAAVAAIAEISIFRIEGADRQFYWRFHSDWKLLFRKGKPTAEIVETDRFEPVMDAWYLDMDRLERLALQGQWEQVIHGSRQLSCVFRNARLSRLQYRILLHLPQDGREGYELNEICANLTSGDIPDEDVLPILKMIGDAVRQGSCAEQDHMKRLFAPLLQRYLRQLEKADSIDTLLDAVGEPLFRYCGGQIINLDGKIQGEFPRDAEGQHRFFERLTTELSRNRKTYIEQGAWYPILRILKTMQTDEALHAFEQIECCFFHRREHEEKDNFYQRQKRGKEESGLLHPEQRKLFSGIVGRWVVDENGNDYILSDFSFLKELAKGSRRIQYENSVQRRLDAKTAKRRRQKEPSPVSIPADEEKTDGGAAPPAREAQDPKVRELEKLTNLFQNMVNDWNDEDGEAK